MSASPPAEIGVRLDLGRTLRGSRALTKRHRPAQEKHKQQDQATLEAGHLREFLGLPPGRRPATRWVSGTCHRYFGTTTNTRSPTMMPHKAPRLSSKMV